MRTTFSSILAAIFFSALALVAQFLISTLAHEQIEIINFSSYKLPFNNIVLVFNQSDPKYDPYIETLTHMYHQDTGRSPVYYNFSDRDSMNAWMYENAAKGPDEHVHILTGFIFRHLDDSPIAPTYDIPVLYNSTIGFSGSISQPALRASIMAARLKWQKYYGSDRDIRYSVTTLSKRTLDHLFGSIAPMLLTGAFLSLIPLFISQPIIDTRGDVRGYMVSCTLTLLPYYAAIFVFDLLLWCISASLIWGLLAAFQTRAILDNMFVSWYTFMLCGPSFIVALYCLSFCFDSAESASRVAFIVICITLLAPIIVDIIRGYKDNPIWYEWFLSFFPHMIMQRSQMAIYMHIGFQKKPLSFYFQSHQHQAFFIMQYVGILIYALILALIEKIRLNLRRGSARHTFQSFSDFFAAEKARHQLTQEARDMESLVLSNDQSNRSSDHNSNDHHPNDHNLNDHHSNDHHFNDHNLADHHVNDHNDFAVKIKNVSRLFFNTAGKPVPAVNCVSLGVRRNSIFGFLGANGAGKTTLIKMITSLLPPSDGAIEVDGVDIAVNNDPTALTVCPQFNNHLCSEMTAAEHFYLYSLIHGLSEEYKAANIEKLMTGLDMVDFKDKPLRELSGGDERKVAVALAFLAPAKIVLLDEPTASLDPVARRHVHEMILSYKGQKTFMLCTHLLSEAEYLCDMISIMIRGCVYTCGTSQYLTQKFGKDYRIEVNLKDGSEKTAEKCTHFFENQLPTASLSITRHKARIYLVPASDHSLSELFRIMQVGQKGDTGIEYFTCSSSSLERVFMELIHMSETDDMHFAAVP